MTSTTYNKSASRQGSFVYEQVIAPDRDAACNGMPEYTIEKLPTYLRDRVVIDPVTGCWVWARGRSSKGYGYATVGGKSMAVHRLSWRTVVGPIPDGYWVDHICRNRPCCNPNHLRLVTPKQNALENNSGHGAVNAAKTHCVNGHEFTPENTIIKPRSTKKENMRRCCYECQRIASMMNKRRKRAAIKAAA